jgi:hypothetical protein
MKRTLLAAATVALLATSAQAVTPKTTLSRSGVWETFITTNDNGVTICGMQVNGRESSLMVKYTGEQIFVQIFKAGWNIPNGTKISGSHTTANASRPMGRLRVRRRPQLCRVQDQGWRRGRVYPSVHGSQPWWSFRSGPQRPFIVDMTGSRTAAVTFTRCAMHLDANANPSPQPFVKDTPQPFGKQPTKTAPTQKKDDGSV